MPSDRHGMAVPRSRRRGPRHAARRTNSALIVAAVALGVLASGVTILTSTKAAFSGTTSNSGNSFTVGSVDLVDDDTGSALFSASNMIPGQTVTRCIVVTYQGTIGNPGPVRIYSGGLTDSGSLATELDLTVEEGTGGTFTTCSGFVSSGTIESGTLADFNTSHTGYANGAGAWDPSTTPESRSYRITITLPSDAANGFQGQSVTGLVFTWEVQS